MQSWVTPYRVHSPSLPGIPTVPLLELHERKGVTRSPKTPGNSSTSSERERERERWEGKEIEKGKGWEGHSLRLCRNTHSIVITRSMDSFSFIFTSFRRFITVSFFSALFINTRSGHLIHIFRALINVSSTVYGATNICFVFQQTLCYQGEFLSPAIMFFFSFGIDLFLIDTVNKIQCGRSDNSQSLRTVAGTAMAPWRSLSAATSLGNPLSPHQPPLINSQYSPRVRTPATTISNLPTISASTKLSPDATLSPPFTTKCTRRANPSMHFYFSLSLPSSSPAAFSILLRCTSYRIFLDCPIYKLLTIRNFFLLVFLLLSHSKNNLCIQISLFLSRKLHCFRNLFAAIEFSNFHKCETFSELLCPLVGSYWEESQKYNQDSRVILTQCVNKNLFISKWK